MRVFSDLAEFVAAKGQHLGYSDWHEVTQEQVNLFADATGDHQWIHVDIERANAGPFGGPIAHGYLTLSLVPMLSHEIYQVDGLRMGVNYGSNKVRFPNPVLVGSRVRGGAELLEITEVAPRHAGRHPVHRGDRERAETRLCGRHRLPLLTP